MEAVGEVKELQGVISLTDAMKNAIVSGVMELLSCIRMLAFNFYKYNTFEPTEELIPIMRSIVSEALRKGVI